MFADGCNRPDSASSFPGIFVLILLVIVSRLKMETGTSTFRTEGRYVASVWVRATESTRNRRLKKSSRHWMCLRDHCNELWKLKVTNISSSLNTYFVTNISCRTDSLPWSTRSPTFTKCNSWLGHPQETNRWILIFFFPIRLGLRNMSFSFSFPDWISHTFFNSCTTLT
jgi:hypothetical protein